MLWLEQGLTNYSLHPLCLVNKVFTGTQPHPFVYNWLRLLSICRSRVGWLPQGLSFSCPHIIHFPFLSVCLAL